MRDHCEQALELLAPVSCGAVAIAACARAVVDAQRSTCIKSVLVRSGDDAQAAAIIDFGLADRSNAVHDLAHTIERNIVEWLALAEDPAHPDNVPLHLDHLHAMLAGYESVRRLSDEEAELYRR